MNSQQSCRKGETVLPKGAANVPANVNHIHVQMTVNTPDAHSFRSTRGQITADMMDELSRVGSRRR
jgi:hypothetical protein